MTTTDFAVTTVVVAVVAVPTCYLIWVRATPLTKLAGWALSISVLGAGAVYLETGPLSASDSDSLARPFFWIFLGAGLVTLVILIRKRRSDEASDDLSFCLALFASAAACYHTWHAALNGFLVLLPLAGYLALRPWIGPRRPYTPDVKHVVEAIGALNGSPTWIHAAGAAVYSRELLAAAIRREKATPSWTHTQRAAALNAKTQLTDACRNLPSARKRPTGKGPAAEAALTGGFHAER